MARHSARVKRLVPQVRSRQAERRQARVAAMSYEELEAEMIRLAVQHGYPGDPAQLDFATAHAWNEQRLREMVAMLSEAERERFLAQNPRLRRPWTPVS